VWRCSMGGVDDPNVWKWWRGVATCPQPRYSIAKSVPLDSLVCPHNGVGAGGVAGALRVQSAVALCQPSYVTL